MRSERSVIQVFILAVALFAAAGGPVSAATLGKGPGGFRYGVGWGIDAVFYSNHYYNFTMESGYSVRGLHNSTLYAFNGYLYGSIGYEFRERFRLMLRGGYSGMGDQYRVFPLTLETTIFTPVTLHTGWTATVEAGVSFHERKPRAAMPLISGGFGYRISLSDFTDLEFSLRYRCGLRKPPIRDPEYNSTVDPVNIRRNTQFLHSIGLGAALVF